MPDFELSVTICSWNTIADTRACLASLRAERQTTEFEVIVVDNASADGSADMIATEFPEFRLIRSETNLGFTGGHNRALAERKGHHAALLNSDTVVHPGAIGTLLEFMRANPEVGVVGPKLLNPDGSLQFSCRRFPNPVAAAFRNTILGRLFPNNRYVKDYLMVGFDHSEEREVDWVSGAALFLRGEVYEKIGGLDPSFFMYCEDVDFCKRTWDAGFRVRYLPSAVITHAIGRSTDRIANKMIIRFHRSMYRYYQKHHLASMNLLLRPFAAGFALAALGTRASLFLLKNYKDVVVRAVRK
ncbi:MAG TPA: glycosyltransferase family 2 protein [Fimbriimonadaceae bacterium]|nr:glycosyltransferase family 2 protein [Fimbriimonadaceae bacterium]HRE94291.1 glycosyltransferase family 2 protein [Fimbriimonadaceae bacterium]HRI74122.1 glycosyltransferase family 2 protein [Fimbriimonadaceae bacterium]